MHSISGSFPFRSLVRSSIRTSTSFHLQFMHPPLHPAAEGTLFPFHMFHSMSIPTALFFRFPVVYFFSLRRVHPINKKPLNFPTTHQLCRKQIHRYLLYQCAFGQCIPFHLHSVPVFRTSKPALHSVFIPYIHHSTALAAVKLHHSASSIYSVLPQLLSTLSSGMFRFRRCVHPIVLASSPSHHFFFFFFNILIYRNASTFCQPIKNFFFNKIQFTISLIVWYFSFTSHFVNCGSC